jgi:hypothetical protein
MRDNEKPPGRELGGFGTIRRIDFREGFRFTVPSERASVTELRHSFQKVIREA